MVRNEPMQGQGQDHSMGGNPMDIMPQMMPPQQQDFQLHKWLMDITVMISNIEDKLKGVTWVMDHRTGDYKPKKGKALMNSDGIHACMSKIEVYCGPNFQFSYFTSDQVNQIMKSLAIEINLEIGCNYIRYGIPKEDVDNISSIILNSVFASLSKAVDGRLMDHIKQIATLTQHQMSTGNMGGQPYSGMSAGGKKRNWFGVF